MSGKPAIPPGIIEPIWDQYGALLPTPDDDHPLGCHRSCIPDRTVVAMVIIIARRLIQVGWTRYRLHARPCR